MISLMLALVSIARNVLLFEGCLHYFLFGGALNSCPFFADVAHIPAQVTIYALYLSVALLKDGGAPHYRSASAREDLQRNLRNVAVPGTGVPLSLFVYNRFTMYVFVALLYPLLCLVSAFSFTVPNWAGLSTEFGRILLCSVGSHAGKEGGRAGPATWFTLWQINCRVSALHYLGSRDKAYALENKWAFLTAAQDAGAPVSPWLDLDGVVLKDKNEEGGLGVFFFRNATHGGKWIIQPVLRNASELAALLPADAPLSTFRVVTASRRCVSDQMRSTGAGLLGALSVTNNSSHKSERASLFFVVCMAFRAGRAGAATDHDAILFDVEDASGKIGIGHSNAHWYKLGMAGLRGAWRMNEQFWQHPDSNVLIAGVDVADHVSQMKAECLRLHERLMPTIPLVGWDVALTPDGMLFLEANLSCNFFMATVNMTQYFQFVYEVFVANEYNQ
ncbi:hypothetical protein FVE85_2631 [Porphyridium purpureum]|uniref:Alpha-L-glutamate ligase-related protein ATP-grasp domain-containing protein n=1 Tax=Porphyridium purpureum TaxID=35688 RepID=A0A5J4YTX4_PORPP|nr:hypothetical protein FVE85_2631 [Porphyridium purpureum]|eukprot:POR5835..scf227_4